MKFSSLAIFNIFRLFSFASCYPCLSQFRSATLIGEGRGYFSKSETYQTLIQTQIK